MRKLVALRNNNRAQVDLPVFSPNLIKNAPNYWCNKSKHVLHFFFENIRLFIVWTDFETVFDWDGLFRIVRDVCGRGVGGVWRSFVIHEMGGQSVSGSDGQKLYYWSVSTLLGFLTWSLKDRGFNWYTGQTRRVLLRQIVGIIDALGKPKRWGG